MQIAFVIEAVQRALAQARPQICNSDQGSQFTSPQYTQLLLAHDVCISMDGREAGRKGVRTVSYLEQVKARVDELHVLYPDRLVPCREEEVARLEQKIGRSLPEAYREFLLWMGHRTGGLWRGTHWLYEDLDAIQVDAVALMQQDAFPVTLPPDAFVFLMHAHYQFAFFRTSEGDDPPVYMYVETDEEIALKISNSHYSDFLLDLVEADQKVIEDIERRHPEKAKKDPYFARRVLDHEERP